MAQLQPMEASARKHWSSTVWPQLLPELAERIVDCLGCNELAVTFRCVNKATAEHFSSPQHTTIRLSEPVPAHAFAAHWLAPGATRGLPLRQRKKLVRLVARSGVLANLEVALQAAGFSQAVAVAFKTAAGTGHVAMCQWIWHDSRSPVKGDYVACRSDEALESAARGGHQHVCEWLLAVDRDTSQHWISKAISAAASNGHLELAKWLLQQDPLVDPAPTYVDGVAHGCDLPTLQQAWLRVRPPRYSIWQEHIITSAASSLTPDWAAKVEWLEAQGCPQTPAAAEEAAGLADHAALQYLVPEVPVFIRDDVDDYLLDVVKGGHLAVLQTLHAAGWPLHQNAQAYAVQAARTGRMDLLAWLLDTLGAEAVRLDEGLFAAAAESGSLELLAWLQQRGCPCHRSAYLAAVGSGCEAALEWLAEQGCPMEEGGQPYITACRNGDLAMARCLRRLGVPWGPNGKVFLGAAEGSFFLAPLPLLRWLLREGCPVDDEAVEATVVRWRSEYAKCADRERALQKQGLGLRQP
ncbi:hypothetical protein GPECTOR_23g19 [Gonium pectorale]|uniref:Uncharacterized protein n=1 Tax=Gonium pectorale TaxID=33097 RepID=A0A150GGX5_GONPE|nr:hypothetical protein GPECTOR_23g19 [Gonium pectorale]|eukprot:KXZ49086.1 hypothetical protein GPECTOR_23g19 [Gonium pectorale]